MNVIVSNKYQTLLANLNIDVIKNINGIFTVDDLVAQFKNFFYNKMILDITALQDYENINVIQNLSVALDMNKVILLLDDSPKVNSAFYLSQLVSMGIYNFTKNVDSIPFLIDNPNSYKDVVSFHLLNVTENDLARNDKQQNDNGFQNFIGQRVIGIKNLTSHAGATTLTYMLKKHLEKLYKVKAIEIDKNDFEYFNDDNLDSISNLDLKDYLTNNSDLEVVLVDLNDSESYGHCSDVIYLIEPGLVQLNRLIREDNRIFDKLSGKKIILNRSVLNQKDVEDFERESGSKVFYNIPNIDDKLDNIKIIKDFLIALGFSRFNDDNSGGFRIF